MLLLALDTATPAVTAALHDGERVLASDSRVDARRHGELLLPAVDRVLAAAGAALGPGMAAATPDPAAAPAASRQNGRRARNVLLIVADDLGYDLGCCGGTLRTPVLDRLAREGTCSPTRMPPCRRAVRAARRFTRDSIRTPTACMD